VALPCVSRLPLLTILADVGLKHVRNEIAARRKVGLSDWHRCRMIRFRLLAVFTDVLLEGVRSEVVANH